MTVLARFVFFDIAVLHRRVGLCGLGTLLTGPRPGQLAESLPGCAVYDTAYRAEDRALEQQRGKHLLPRDIAMRGIRCLFLVDERPQALEHLLADQPGDQTPEDAEGKKQDLAHQQNTSYARCILRVSRGSTNGSRSAG